MATGSNNSGVFKCLAGKIPLLVGGYQVKYPDGDDSFPALSDEVLRNSNYMYVAVYKDGKLFKVETAVSRLSSLFYHLIGNGEVERLLRKHKRIKLGEYIFMNTYLPIPSVITTGEVGTSR